MWRQLFWKELRESRSVLLLTNLVAFLLLLYVALDRRVPPGAAIQLAFVLLLIPLIRVPQHALTSWRREWAGHHDLLLLSLPVRGWLFVTAKLSVALLETVSLTVTVLVSYSVGRPELVQPLFDLVGTGPLLYGILLWGLLPGILATLLLHIVGQLAALVSRTVPLVPSLAAVVTFAAGLWLVVRAGGLLGMLFRWLPSLPVYAITVSNFTGYELWLRVQAASLVGALLVLGGLCWVAGWLVERAIEA